MSDIDDLIIQPENDSKIDKILNAPKSGKERLSEAWDAGYAGPIATTVAGAGAGYMAYNKISNTYEKNLADLVKAQKTEREAVNLLRTSKGEPVKDIRLVQAKPSTTSPIPDYSRKFFTN